MDYDYVIDVVAGSKACIAGYSAAEAYITVVWHIIGIYRRERESLFSI